jgi:YgiT-type zinc finger domain-containing protein
MTTSKALEWGACPCGGQYENRMVEIRMKVKDQPIVLAEVPQGFCSRCGSRVYKAEVLERIESVMKAESPDRRLNRQMA